MAEPSSLYQNVYGRKPGRGIRPYVILPKYVFVSIFVGGLFSMLVQGFLLPTPDQTEDWRRREWLLTNSYVFVIVPGLLGGMITGLVLLFTHFSVFIRMRWLQVKLVLIAICVPTLHFYMRGKAQELHAVLARGTAEDLQTAAALWSDLRGGTIASIAFALMIVFLGRIKPRLGQDYGRTFTHRPSGVPATGPGMKPPTHEERPPSTMLPPAPHAGYNGR
jgi:hypothetical protein